jgi:hypothetical protein
MAENPEGMWSKEDRDRLATLLDQINAVQIDLRALCDRRKSPQPVSNKTLAEAADILRAAATGLRDVVHRLDDMSSPRHPE